MNGRLRCERPHSRELHNLQTNPICQRWDGGANAELNMIALTKVR
jgi:hypothetical protein